MVDYILRSASNHQAVYKQKNLVVPPKKVVYKVTFSKVQRSRYLTNRALGLIIILQYDVQLVTGLYYVDRSIFLRKYLMSDIFQRYIPYIAFHVLAVTDICAQHLLR